ncbi:unnamed protein product, partial [marine sediment metagenome]
MIGKYFNKRKIEPNPINKFHSLGIYYFKIEKYQKAIECFKKVLTIEPDHLDSKNKIELLVIKLEKKENHSNGENSLESNNIKEQEGITFVNIPKDEKIVKKHKRLSDGEIKHYQKIFQLYKEHCTLEKVGKEVGRTRERIRQILKKGDRYG